MNPEQFAELAEQNYNRIPVTREILADLDTPLSTYLKLARGPYSYLFESVEGGEKWGRYSMIGLPCKQLIKVFGNTIHLQEVGREIKTQHSDDPFDFIGKFIEQIRVPVLDNLPRFSGGLVGYFGYDAVRYVEKRLANSTPKDELGTPDILLMVSDELVVFDNLSGTITLIVYVNPSLAGALDKAVARLDEIESALERPAPKLPRINLVSRDLTELKFVSSMGQERYEAAVEKIKAYTQAGDVMQVVPSQRLSLPFEAEPINLYRALRNLNPSPYLYYLDLDEFHIVGSSPEMLARLEHGEVNIRPIAGTRRRGKTPEEDIALEKEMLTDPKEIAEHLMLIDLARNDVGRIAQTGTVAVSENMVVERFSHVMHITSNVVGEIKPGLTALDVLKASLPAGTLSGAPKIRAMEIIDEIETVKRGIYGGAVGYLGWNGNLDTAIAIRTALIKDGKLFVQAGGGIVADSIPTLEWKETMNKARAIFRAADMVLGGIDK